MSPEELQEILQQNGIAVTKEQMSQFALYASMLQEWNQRMNLTAIRETAEIYEKHFLDCALPAFERKISGSLCDVGAGAGFPSLPLKILLPDLRVTIIEPIGKRCQFLRALTEALGLSDVVIVNARAEDYAKEHRETFDFVTARAVANLRVLSELCIPLVKIGGVFLAMKGSAGIEEAKEAQRAIALLGCAAEAQDVRRLGTDSLRCNLIYRKEKPTPKQYPRNYAMIKKKPL